MKLGFGENFPIPPELREQLKHPLGRLIPDPLVREEALLQYFADDQAITACVGDRTTERVHELGFSPKLEIVDSLEKRTPRDFPKLFDSTRIILKSSNPQGTISRPALAALRDALKIMGDSPENRVRIEVAGEEDLLVLPVIAFFPEPTFALYGQPHEGMVVVSSTAGGERSRAILKGLGITSID
jgi:uncharacterized protein (UPF0218 family)